VGAEGKNGNEIISRIIADLAAKSEGGEELSAAIHRLSDELKKVIQSEDTIFGKFRGLLESFRGVIPDEKQRYQAAVAAMATTSKLSRQEVVGAVAGQLAELKILEKGLVSAFPGRRGEVDAMQARARDIRDEVAKLRERTAQLESEEKKLLGDIASREKESGLVEQEVGKIFADIGSDIAGIKQKIESFTSELAASQPAPSGDSIFPNGSPGEPPAPQGITHPSAQKKSDAPEPALSGGAIFPDEAMGGGGEKNELPESSASRNAGLQKKCPMCGGRMDFNIGEKIWMCYSCAYEEKGDALPEASPAKSGGPELSAPGAAPGAPAPPDSGLQKKCPMCGGRMDFNIGEKAWMCYSCAHEEKADAPPEMDSGQSEGKTQTKESKPAPSIAVPLADMLSDDLQKQKKGLFSLKSGPAIKKKTCPVCRKKMNWFEMERVWRCSSCEYERGI
jgi:ribosomal protein L37AE/L43A